jgi:type II secretory pathway pseudopilin PulG
MPAGSLSSGIHRESGFTYVSVLATLAVMSLGLAAVGPMWADQVQRERESDLLRFGALYAEAIARYHDTSPGSPKQWPLSLDDLLLDTRFAGTVRHLRRLYPDPTDPTRPWGLVLAPEGGIVGVHSQNTDRPLRRESMQVGDAVLPKADRYDQWQFLARAER